MSAKTVAIVSNKAAVVRTEARMNLRMAAPPQNEPDEHRHLCAI